MRTRAKRKYVASDRARRENVLRHILYLKTMQGGTSMKTDIEIAQEAQMLPITEVVKEIGLTADERAVRKVQSKDLE